MASDRSYLRNRPRGIAMFVVLGTIVLMTLLGYVGLQLASNDTSLSGSLVDIKSQRMTAIAGLNMAIARLEHSTAGSSTTLGIINDFNAAVAAGTPKQWLDFSGNAPALSATANWTTLASGTDTRSACKVRILGVEAIGTGSSLKITLESTGRGRSGDEHTVVATYNIIGLYGTRVVTTNGPVNALMSTGEIGHIDAGVTMDAPIYTGGGTLLLQGTAGTLTKFGQVRTKGNVYIDGNSDVEIAENSIVDGFFRIGVVGHEARFLKNLVVGHAGCGGTCGGILNIGGLDGNLKVNGWFYLYGTQTPNPINHDVAVGGMFYVADMPFVSNGNITVGTSASDTGKAWFPKGIKFNGGSSNQNVNVYGRMDVGNATSITTPTNIPMTANQFSGVVYVKKNLNVYGTSPVFLTTTNVKVDGNAAFAGALSCNNSRVDGTKPALDVTGQTYLGGGISDIDGTSSTVPGMLFRDQVYLVANGQKTFVNSFARFMKPLTISGTLDVGFGLPAGYYCSGSNCVNFGNTKRWDMAGTVASDKTWTYSKTQNPDPAASYGMNYPSFDTRIDNGTYVTTIPTSTITSTFPLPTLKTLDELGYSAADQNLEPSSNLASGIFLDTLYRKFPNLATNASWKTIKDRYSSICSDLVDAGGAPTGNGLKCIYDNEKGKDPAVDGLLWNNEYLVIRITTSDDYLLFQNFGQSGKYDITKRVIPSGVKILWDIRKDFTVNNVWYSGEDKTAVQVLVSQSALMDFGWSNNFYGFIQFQVTGNSMRLRAGTNSVLYGSMEFSQSTSSVMQNARRDASVPEPLTILRNNDNAKSAIADIVANFSIPQATTAKGLDGPVILFNGDHSIPSSSITLGAWSQKVQFQLVGEFR